MRRLIIVLALLPVMFLRRCRGRTTFTSGGNDCYWLSSRDSNYPHVNPGPIIAFSGPFVCRPASPMATPDKRQL